MTDIENIILWAISKWNKSVYCNQWWGGNGCQGFYIKQMMWGREQDSGETEREKECERQSIGGNEG